MRTTPVVAAVVTLLVAAAPRPAAAADADSLRLARLADYVDRIEAYGFSGQIVVAENGRVVLERACGWADRRFAAPMTMETRLGIGSVTKAFVAAAILRLESQGKLATTDPIGGYLPEVPPDKAAITIAELLCHTGGVRRDVPNIPDASPRDEVVRAVLGEPLADAPGGPFHYSNSGFDLLAAIVERVSGTGLDAFARRELLAPAGMTASGIVGSPGLPGGPAARGYNEWKEVSAWTEWPDGWRGTGSGRMVSTARDLWRWGEAVQNGKALSAAEWQRMSARQAMQDDSSSFYGFGVHISEIAGGRTLFTMGGDVDGYRAELRLYPASQRIIVVMTNQDLFALGVQRRTIANTLSRLAQGQDPPLPPAPAKPAVHDSALGAWQLPTGGTIEIWSENGALRLGARGQDAVDLFEPDPADTTGTRARLARVAQTLMRAAASDDSALAHSALSPAEYAFAYPFLARRLRALDALHDGLREVVGLGMVSLPWDPDTRRAYFRLDYVDGVEDLFLGWRGATLNDVTFGEGRPFPSLYGLVAVEGGGYATWDSIRQRATRFRLLTPASATPRLVLTATAGEISAKKVR